MNEPAYLCTITKDALTYQFDSISEQHTITKIIQFAPFPDNALFYNLGLGDVLEDGTIDDLVISNNQDMNRVIATVFQAIVTFFERYPTKLIYFQGSDRSGIRTRLYRVLIARELKKATELFTIYGRCPDDSIEEFIPNHSYVGFIFQPKPSKSWK